MKSGLAKRYDTCDVLNILEDIPSDDTSKESSEPDDNHEDYVPPDIDANEELKDRNNVEFIEPAAPMESTRSQDKITKTNTSNPNPKRKLRSPDVKVRMVCLSTVCTCIDKAFIICIYELNALSMRLSSLSRATWCLIIMQFIGCQQPVQHSYSPENAIDWLA